MTAEPEALLPEFALVFSCISAWITADIHGALVGLWIVVAIVSWLACVEKWTSK